MRRGLKIAMLVALTAIVAKSTAAQTSISSDGVIESTSGGFKFPDMTMQTEACSTSCSLFGPGANCAGQVLTGSIRTDRWAPGANLASATLDGADFSRTDMSGANLSRVFAVNNPVLFHDASLRAAVLRRANLDGADFRDADGVPTPGAETSPLCSVVPLGADLMSATLEAADLRNSHFESTYMLRANLTNSVLTNADFDEAELGAAILEGATLFGADFGGACLQGADLSRVIANEDAGLPPVDLSDAVLFGANLRNAGLRGANVRSAVLAFADLSHANLDLADLCGASNMDSANLEGTFISAATTCPDGSPAGGDLSCTGQFTPAVTCP